MKKFKSRKELMGIEDPRLLNVWMETANIEFVRDYAKRNNTTMSEIVRTLVRDFVKKVSKEVQDGVIS